MSRRGGGDRQRNYNQRDPPSPAQRGRGRGAAASSSQAPYRHESPASSTPNPSDVASVSSVSQLSQNMEHNLSLTGSSAPPNPVPSSSKPAVRFPPRPGFGTVGKKCVVRANHFLVQIQDKDLHHYDVSISPEVASRGVNRAVIKQLVDTYWESHLGKYHPVYDGRKSLYTAGPLPFTSKEFVIKLGDKVEKVGAPRREREFKVTIRFASKADLHHMREFLCGRRMETSHETIQVLDVVLRESPTVNYIPVRRSFFSPHLGDRSSMDGGLEVWKGFYQSIRPTQMGLSLNIDLSATSFYQPIPVIEFVSKLLNIRYQARILSEPDRIKVKKALRGVKVEVIHRADACRSFRVTGITSLPTDQLTFPVDEGVTMSVVQYFKDKYNFVLKYASWPCLQSGSDKKPIYLPMEVCKIVEGQMYPKKLNERQVTEILRAACQRPSDRENNIVGMVRHNNYNGDKYVSEFGIQVNDRLTSVEARVLPPPLLKYHETGREVNCHPRIGQWNMINKKMVNGGTVDYWTCLNFSRLNPDRFCYELVTMCGNIGMKFKDPCIPFRAARPNDIERALRNVHAESTAHLARVGEKEKSFQLLIVILPETSGLYGRIKRICETELGLVSQCCLPKNVAKCNKQYLENVALKINVKVGGRNTVLADAVLKRIPLVTDVPTIIFGADVTHPQPGEDSSPSIAAVVASMDWPEVTKYRGLVSAQSHREELMINNLFKTEQDPQKGITSGGMIRELLIAFKKATGFKPHRIIFYRDGVSEGQFSQVLLHELDAIRMACASLQEDYMPPVTFVVVQKRHHTRLFPADHRNRDLTDKSGNILPGTVVDTKICHPTEFDFYLCSHAGIQGTSRPTHYHVLYDENRFTPDALQTLTNNLCYTYARCTRSVSIVPPAYYAHLAAFRARCYTEGDYSDSGSTVGGRGLNTRERNVEVRPLPEVKDTVKAVMFYC